MPTPYHTLSDDALNLLAERGNAQALMELAHRAERLGILAEAQELANRLREGSKDEKEDCGFQEDGKPEPDIPDPSREPVCICDDGRSGHCPVHDVTW